jgi:hypothetical protein
VFWNTDTKQVLLIAISNVEARLVFKCTFVFLCCWRYYIIFNHICFFPRLINLIWEFFWKINVKKVLRQKQGKNIYYYWIQSSKLINMPTRGRHIGNLFWIGSVASKFFWIGLGSDRWLKIGSDRLPFEKIGSGSDRSLFEKIGSDSDPIPIQLCRVGTADPWCQH